MLGDVDQLLARLKRRLPSDAAPLARLRALNQFFFHDLSFGGNVIIKSIVPEVSADGVVDYTVDFQGTGALTIT